MKRFFTPTPEDDYLRKHMKEFLFALLVSVLIVMAGASLIAWIIKAVFYK